MGTEFAVVWGRPEAGLDVARALSSAREFAAAHGVEVQLFDAASVVNSDHLRSAAAHALRAHGRGTMRTGSLPVEMLLYAAGRRQIKEAMAVMGLSERTECLAAVLVGPGAAASAARLLKAIHCSPLSEKEAAGGAGAMERLKISARGATPEQLADLALEQVALLDIEK